jgi:hypothetical protein
MANASIITIADAIVTRLNAVQVVVSPAVSPFAPYTFTAKRDYAPVLELTELGTLRVLVCPMEQKSGVPSRKDVQQDDGIDIGILYKPSTYDQTSPSTTIDPLMLLVEQISDCLKFQTLGGSDWLAAVNSPIFDASDLREKKQFTSVLSITLRRRR